MNKIIKLHWNNYLNSDSGKEVVAAFDKLTDPNATMEELLQLASRFDPEFFRNTSTNERNQELGFLDFFNRDLCTIKQSILPLIQLFISVLFRILAL